MKFKMAALAGLNLTLDPKGKSKMDAILTLDPMFKCLLRNYKYD